MNGASAKPIAPMLPKAPMYAPRTSSGASPATIVCEVGTHSISPITKTRIIAVPAVAAMILVFVIGEMLWVPTSQTIVAGLAPEDVRGAYMGAFGSMGAIGFALAPFIGLQIRAAYGDAAVWAAVAALSVVAAAIGAAACRIAVARRPRPAGAAA